MIIYNSTCSLSIPDFVLSDKRARIVSGLKNVECLVGQKAAFKCQVSEPGQRLKWFKNGKEIKPDVTKFDVVIDGCSHTLVVKDAQLEDGVEYTAKLTDDDTTSATLIVEGKIIYYVTN